MKPIPLKMLQYPFWKPCKEWLGLESKLFLGRKMPHLLHLMKFCASDTSRVWRSVYVFSYSFPQTWHTDPEQYHDDGEDTLGETVATLSLGASSTMCFRPKNNSTIGGVLKSKGSKVSKKDYVQITLNHGDIIVMHGSGLHKYYEVSTVLWPLRNLWY